MIQRPISLNNEGAYKPLSRKSDVETLRKRGIEWTGDGPVRSVKLPWLPYVTDPRWLTVERWIEFANQLDREELRNTEPSPETLDRLPGWQNFGIRNYQLVDDKKSIYERVRKVWMTLRDIAATPQPAGIEHVEPDPLMLFLLALGTATANRIRSCVVCEKIFYAQRKDRKACSPDCANINRQRSFRRNQPRYEATRKKNRKAEKAREEKKMKEIRAAVAKPRFK